MKAKRQNGKPLFMVILAITLLQVSANAQSEPVAVAVPDGIFIYLGEDIPRQSYYEVELKSDRGKFTKLARINAPENQQSLEERIMEYGVYFENLDPLTEPEKEKLWNYVRTSASMNSLYIPNLPLLHLAAGTAYFDKQQIIAGKQFQYRVTLYQVDGTMVRRHETNKVTAPAQPDILKPQFKGKRESANQILLEWYVPEQRQLSSYRVFRRVFGQGEFRNAEAIKGFNTQADSVFLIVIDTAIHNPALYEYYVLPLDAYGNPGPASDFLNAGTIGEKYIPVVQNLRARSSGRDHEVIVSWEFENRKYLRNLELYRSMSFDSGFVKIATLPPSDTSYVDHLPYGSENYYYYVVLHAPFARSYPSAVVSVLYHDTSAPEPPVEVAAETIHNGVRIHWVYEEPFVKGFQVYRSDLADSGFALISELIPAGSRTLYYTDTSRALAGNRSFYYVVEAISDSDISSRRSTPVSGAPGIKTQISSPRHVNARWQDESVLVSWDDLSETEADLMGYAIYRKDGNQDFQLVYEQQDGRVTNYFHDVNTEQGRNYQYAVKAKDFYGAESGLSEIADILVPVSKPAAPSGVTLTGTRDGIHVAWGRVSDPNLSRLVLCRQEVGQSPTPISTFGTDQLDYLDKTAVRGKLYSYFLISVDFKNTESNPGQLSTIRY